jgi:CheY-like chemotaxis protein
MAAQKILNVDDREFSAYPRTRALTAAGFEVIEARTGLEALRIAADEKPVLVLLDVNLPDISGFEVCRQLRKNPATKGILVAHISVTEQGTSDQVVGLEAGADAYILEPVESEVMVATIKALIRGRGTIARQPTDSDDTQLHIFLSYRRQDGGYAGRLHDRLKAHFGSKWVFIDVDKIAPGHDFRSVIRDQIARCDVVIAVIGRTWLRTKPGKPSHQQTSGTDWVQFEIATALRRGIPVMPVLVGGAAMPVPEELPRSLAKLRYAQILEIRDSSFHADTDRLIRAVQKLVKP